MKIYFDNIFSWALQGIMWFAVVFLIGIVFFPETTLGLLF